MIPLLTIQAVEKKCTFEHVILLGNYELCYGLGIISKAAGLPKEEKFDNVGELKKRVIEAVGDYEPEEITMKRLLAVVKEMDGYTENNDDQMYELYEMGYAKGVV